MKVNDMTEIKLLKILVKIHKVDFDCQKNITLSKIKFVK